MLLSRTFSCVGRALAGTLALVLVQPAMAVTEYEIVIDAGEVIRTVDDRHFGLNATIWDEHFANGTTIELLAAAGTRALRFGGGSLSNQYHWQTNTTLDNTWEWATSFDEFAAVATEIDAQVFITANYGTGTPEEAAAWVAYSNVTKGYGFKYWEIGNENYGTWETDHQAVPHDPYTYAVRFKEYMAQMKAVDPTIKVGAVIINGEDAYANNTMHPATNPRTGLVHNGWTPVLLTTLKSIGAIPDYVIYHRYEGAPGVENDATLLRSARTWPDDAANIRQMLTDYLGAEGAAVEMVVTENNSVFGSPGKQSTSIVNGLFLADSFGNLLQTEFNAFVWWDIRNGQEAANNNSASLYGWRNYGDYGVLHGPSGTYPTYHVHKLLQHFARAGDRIVKATCDDDNVSAFAALGADDTLRILLVSKYPETLANEAKAWISIWGFDSGGLKTEYTYGHFEDDAARTGIGSPDIRVEDYEPPPPDPPWEGGGTVAVVNVVPLPGYTAKVLVFRHGKPFFTAQPFPQLPHVGAPFTLVADVGGWSTSTVQWYRNGVAIPGAISETYSVASATQAHSGVYTVQATNVAGSSTSRAAVVIVGTLDGRLINLSTRGPVRTGGELMIAGFYLGGTGPRTMLIRGVGPGLVPYNLDPAEVLADPRITLFREETAILENNDWGAQASGIPDIGPTMLTAGAFPLAIGSKDAALVATLDPGRYSVHVTGADGGTGVALVELYDFASPTGTARLKNISTRGYASGGNSIMIPGIVVGSAGRMLLVRGIGPGMPGENLPPLLPDPVIRVVDRDGNEIFANDNWGSAASAPWVAEAASANGAFPLPDGSKDAACIVVLPPGPFTVHVSDKNGASGVALVEVYEMPEWSFPLAGKGAPPTASPLSGN